MIQSGVGFVRRLAMGSSPHVWLLLVATLLSACGPTGRGGVGVEAWFALIPLFFILVTLVPIIVAIIDIVRVPDDALLRTGTKGLWIAAVIFGGIVGVVVYFAVARPDAQDRARIAHWRQTGQIPPRGPAPPNPWGAGRY